MNDIFPASDWDRTDETLELRELLQIQRTTIRQFEEEHEKAKKVEMAMTLYFDALYQQLIRITNEKDKEFEKDQYIDRIMEEVYDSIHLAFDSIVKERTHELEAVHTVLSDYDTFLKESIHDRTHELSEENRRLKEVAMTDELTGLTNRRGFFVLSQIRFTEAVKRGQVVTILFIDLDGFKNINDTYGHAEGDWLLKKVAWILHRSFRSNDIICRYGGDEFAVFIESDDIHSALMRLETLISEFNSGREKRYILGLSIGWETLLAESDIQVEDIVRKADQKMYEKKKSKIYTSFVKK